MEFQEKISEEIKELPADVRAEVIADQLMQGRIPWHKMMFHFSCFFYRNFSRDIYETKISDEGTYKERLHVYVTRPGLYDILPEGLFFRPGETGTSPMTAGEMAEEYRVDKKQEMKIRRFFSPFENEFFFHSIKNFQSEKGLLKGIRNETLARYFIHFWNLPSNIELSMAVNLVLLLPLVHTVAGNPGLMAECLECIINEKVTCTVESSSRQSPQESFNLLGGFELGNEFICGNTFTEEMPVFVFTIHHIKHSAVQDFIPGGKHYSLLQHFYRFFVPVNAEVKTEIMVTGTKAIMKTGNTDQAVLGISTFI